jgi:Carbohydrate/starch-binding module (family 21)
LELPEVRKWLLCLGIIVNAMKKLIVLFLWAALTSAVQLWAKGEVKLRYMRYSNCPPISGCYRSFYAEGLVEVQNIAPKKRVKIIYRDSLGTWKSARARYLMSIGEGDREIWSFSNLWPIPTQIAVSYTVAGKTYWDNNSGNNYHAEAYTFGALLGPDIHIENPHGELNSTDSIIAGTITVRNLVSHKKVTVVYTTDNWTTVERQPASYQASYSPEFESWQYTLPIPRDVNPSHIKMAFLYNLKGSEHWADNNGNYFHLSDGVIARF